MIEHIKIIFTAKLENPEAFDWDNCKSRLQKQFDIFGIEPEKIHFWTKRSVTVEVYMSIVWDSNTLHDYEFIDKLFYMVANNLENQHAC